MARRNPMNARYQKNTAPAGKTRKSAAAAKPSRSVASPSAGKAPTKGAKGSSAAKGKGNTSAFMAVDTPEFRYWRRIWWISVIAALVLTAVSFALLSLAHLRVASNIVLGLAYFAIISSMYIDWSKIRPMRKAAYQAAQSGKTSKPKSEKTETPAKADSAETPSSTERPGTAESSETTETSDTEGKA